MVEHGCALERQVGPGWADTPEGRMLLAEFRADKAAADGEHEGDEDAR